MPQIGLRENQRVLDIGCGWVVLVKFAAERYGARAVGVTVSKIKQIMPNKIGKNLPVEIKLQIIVN